MNSHTLLEVQRLANAVRKAAVAFNLASQAAARANIVVEVEERTTQITGCIPQTCITVATRVDPCMVYADPVTEESGTLDATHTISRDSLGELHASMRVAPIDKKHEEFTQYRLDASPNYIRVQRRKIAGGLYYLWTHCSPSFKTFEEATAYAAEHNLGPLMTEAEVNAFDERLLYPAPARV